jgi:hypothetical protein
MRQATRWRGWPLTVGARKKRSQKPSGTRAERLLKEVVFFTDRSLGLGVPQALRDAGYGVERHADHFEEDAPDAEWLVVVGARGWVVFAKDKAIRRKAHERQAVIRANVRLFALTSGNLTGAEMIEVFLGNMLRIGRVLLKNEPPFIAAVNRGGVALLELGEEEA